MSAVATANAGRTLGRCVLHGFRLPLPQGDCRQNTTPIGHHVNANITPRRIFSRAASGAVSGFLRSKGDRMQVSEVTRGVFAAFNTDGTGTVSKQLFIRFLANRGLLACDQRLEVRVTLDRI